MVLYACVYILEHPSVCKRQIFHNEYMSYSYNFGDLKERWGISNVNIESYFDHQKQAKPMGGSLSKTISNISKKQISNGFKNVLPFPCK